MAELFKNADEFTAWQKRFEAGSEGEYKRPDAFGIGLARPGPNHVVPFLDMFFPVLNFQENYGTAAVLADVIGYRLSNMWLNLSEDDITRANRMLAVFRNDGRVHPNLDLLASLPRAGDDRVAVAVFIADTRLRTKSLPDAYLRMTLVSAHKATPRAINQNGTVDMLPRLAWTSRGPMLPADARRCLATGERDFTIHRVGRLPRLLDYVVPEGEGPVPHEALLGSV